jgi:hypothetical protein
MDHQATMVDLLEHLLGEYWGYSNQGPRPELRPGEIAELPVEVPIPEGSRIVGSVLWPQQQTTTIVFDCNLTREQVIQFYEEQLLSQGWIKPQMNDPFGAGGFTRGGQEWDFGAHFCLGERGPSLHVRSFAEPTRPTSVFLSLNTDPEQSPCSPRQRRQYAQMGHLRREMLPELRPPAGATQLGGGSSGGGGADNAHSEAWLKTDLDIGSTLSHYSEQLVKARWIRIDSGHDGPIGWSSWDFTYEDENWHGMLTVTQRPWLKGEYRLRLYAEVEGFGQHGGVVFVGHF